MPPDPVRPDPTQGDATQSDATQPDDAALGEFALIDRIIERLGAAAASDILVPPGDDAAVWETPDDADGAAAPATVATIDTLAEGTHWRSDTMSMADVGWRAVATTLSDIAAMGATPERLLIAVMLAPDVGSQEIDAFVDGLALSARFHGARVVGGDIVRAASTAFTVTALGRAARGPDGRPALLRRDAAVVGDAVAVSGTPGAAAAGLAAIESGRAELPAATTLVAAYRRPRAQIALGQAAVAAGLRCGIDISDGLLQDLGHVARRSHVGIVIDLAQLPLHPSAVWVLGAHRTVDLALGGGDDYELAFTGPPATLESLAAGDFTLHTIGSVVAEHPGEVVVLDHGGRPYNPAVAGWDQLRGDAPELPQTS